MSLAKNAFMAVCAAAIALPLVGCGVPQDSAPPQATIETEDLSATVSIAAINGDFSFDQLSNGLHRATISTPGQDNINCFVIAQDSYREGYGAMSCDFNDIADLQLTQETTISTQKIADLDVDTGMQDGLTQITIREKDGTTTDCIVGNEDSYREGYASMSCNFR